MKERPTIHNCSEKTNTPLYCKQEINGRPKMDESQLTPEEIETELTQGVTFHTIYAITCLYHLKPSKKIKKHYKELPIELREDFEKTAIEQGLFERTNNTIVVTTKGVDFLMDNILTHVDATMAFVSTLKEISETYDENEECNDDNYTENEVDQENKLPSKNIRRQEKRKQKRHQNQI
jgi:hypothetical protein